jgi:diguanylate cyclase (GGDEF)-like protein
VRIISRIAQELRALTDLPTFVNGARKIVAEELGYEHVEIMLNARRPSSMSTGNGDGQHIGSINEYICREAIEMNRARNIPDLDSIKGPGGGSGSALAVPLRVDNEVIGALGVFSNRYRAFTIVDEALLTVAANQLAAGLSVAQLHDQIKWTARHDALTQALNHGAFYEELARAIEHHTSTREPVSLILCDVEGLKAVNDRLGHLAGDSVLRSLVRRLRSIVRDRDIVARYGGDEFAIISFGTSRAEAKDLTKRLFESLHRHPLLRNESSTHVTTGIAQVGEDSLTPAELVRIADDRLYKAREHR